VARGRGMPAKPAKKPTQEELDEERLREIEAKVKELLQLISDGHDRERADAALGEARARRDEQAGNRRERTYHKEDKATNKAIPMTQHTSAHLKLASALKLRIRLGEYALELEDSLARLAEEQVEVLERKLKRARY
jgi:hypothetical protein